MSKYKAMKFWIGDDPELSEKVQKLLFSMGYTWLSGSVEIKHTEEGCLYASRGGRVTQSSGGINGFFAKEDKEEINIDWMRATKPETIELNGKTYVKSELEEALRHIKPVGE